MHLYENKLKFKGEVDMSTKTIINILGIVGCVLTIAANSVNDKLLDAKIAEAVADALKNQGK